MDVLIRMYVNLILSSKPAGINVTNGDDRFKDTIYVEQRSCMPIPQVILTSTSLLLEMCN
jgi:hypothetical protein